jgi:hypothetical protein
VSLNTISLTLTLMQLRHLVVVISVALGLSEARDWKVSGRVRWDFNCDYNGQDTYSVSSRPEDCGNICASSPGCCKFTYWDGVCYLKNGRIEGLSDKTGAVCGHLKDDPVWNKVRMARGWYKWRVNCDFPGHDWKQVQSRGEDCGKICENESECFTFTWTPFNGGTFT